MGGGLCEGVSGGGGHPRRIFRFQPADFPADFFGGFFLCILRPIKIHHKIHRKIHRKMDSSCFRNPPALRHQKFTGLPPPPGRANPSPVPSGLGPSLFRVGVSRKRLAVGWPCMECHVPCHISLYWVWDSVKQSEGWGRNTALIARSPTRHSIFVY